ncbi:ArsR/SmtB family transcription factor [Streptosporangium canum]|uniref:ArsR/SmtB family transcription factor n=1 Tax=Streptosporangium canum TaxID=324952 RepID=UPI003692ED08
MRIHFTAADLRQITLAPGPTPLWETAVSVHRLRLPATVGPRLRFGLESWEREVRGGLRARAGVVLDLIPREDFLPGFLLQPSAGDLAEGLDLVMHAPSAQVSAGLSLLAVHQEASRWSQELAADAPGAREVLRRDLKRYFTSSLASRWPQVQASGVADRALRSETLLRGGVDALLATLVPQWRWQAPTLHIPFPRPWDVDLGGRGLLLVPSYFILGALLMRRPGKSTVLAYPVYRGDRPACATDALGPLLGRTRAAVLAVLRDPATTTAVAERVGVSIASASQHATVLRGAGLVSTTRMGGAVLHVLTPLGAALLHGDATAT